MMLQCAPLSAQLQAIDVPEAGRPGKAAEAFSSEGGNRSASRKRVNSTIRGSVSISSKRRRLEIARLPFSTSRH
jgi:hypothetical protein